MKSPLTELLSTPYGTVDFVGFNPPGSPSSYVVPALAVHAPIEVARAAGSGERRPCAMSLCVVEREQVAFFFFGVVLEDVFYSFTVNPGQKGALVFLEYVQAQGKGLVFLVLDENRVAVTMQGLPQDKLEAALKVARQKPKYVPQEYNRALTSFFSGRSELEVARSLFAREEFAGLMLRAHVGEGAELFR